METLCKIVWFTGLTVGCPSGGAPLVHKYLCMPCPAKCGPPPPPATACLYPGYPSSIGSI